MATIGGTTHMNKSIQKKGKGFRPGIGRKRKFIYFCIVSFLLLTTLMITISNYRLEHLIIEGSTRYTQEELEGYLVQSKLDQITFITYLKHQVNEPISIPFIETYSLTMEKGNTLKVRLYEKVLIGCVELFDSYMYFDRDGMVVESSKERIDTIPLITGLKFDKIILNEKLAIQNNNLFDMILNLTNTIQKFQLSVEKVFINSNYEVTLYCNGSEVLLGKKDFYDVQLEALTSVMESSKDMKLLYDLRYYDEINKKITAKPLD